MILILYSIFLKKISSIISWCLIANIPSVNIEHKKMLADIINNHAIFGNQLFHY